MATSVTLKPNAIDISGSTSGTTTLQASAVAGTTTLTLPAATDTLVGKATTDTLTNKTLTGAAMNGTLGATTPSTASVTTLTTSSTVTHSGGTANGVAYLDGSKVLTTGSALVFDGTNLGLGVTPSAWATLKALQIGYAGFFGWPSTDYAGISSNTYYTGSGGIWNYISTNTATRYTQGGGSHVWGIAPSGTAGTTATFTQAMTLDASGALLTGGTSYYGDWGGGAGTIQATSTSYANISAGSSRSDQNSVRIGSFTFDWSTNTSGYRTRAIIEAQSNGSTANKRGADLLFYTASDNVASPTERARIDSSGNLLVGTTTGASSTSALMQLKKGGVQWDTGPNGSNGGFNVLKDGTTGVYLTSGATAWSGLSDETMKDIIEPIENASQKISTLRTVIGKYKTDEEGTRRAFLIAQDVEKVLPEAVNENENGKLGLQYTDVIPLMVAAIKEQQAIIQSLTARITALESA